MNKGKGFVVIVTRDIKHPRSGDSMGKRVYLVTDPRIRVAFGRFPSIDAERSGVFRWSGDDLSGRQRIYNEAVSAGYDLVTEDEYLARHGY